MPAVARAIPLGDTSLRPLTRLRAPCFFCPLRRLYPKDFMVPLAQFLAVMYIAPRFRDKPGRVSAYEVLEERFNVGLRLYGEGSCSRPPPQKNSPQTSSATIHNRNRCVQIIPPKQ